MTNKEKNRHDLLAIGCTKQEVNKIYKEYQTIFLEKDTMKEMIILLGSLGITNMKSFVLKYPRLFCHDHFYWAKKITSILARTKDLHRTRSELITKELK